MRRHRFINRPKNLTTKDSYVNERDKMRHLTIVKQRRPVNEIVDVLFAQVILPII